MWLTRLMIAYETHTNLSELESTNEYEWHSLRSAWFIAIHNRASLARKGSLAIEVSAAFVYCIIHLRPNPAVAPSHCYKHRIGPFSSGNRKSISDLIADLVSEGKNWMIRWTDSTQMTPRKNTWITCHITHFPQTRNRYSAQIRK